MRPTAELEPAINDDDNGSVEDDNDDASLFDDWTDSLECQVLDVIERAPRLTIAPARLAAAVGLSIEDATAELCGLSAAVGGGYDGATFAFHQAATNDTRTPPPPPVMVFTFPKGTCCLFR